MARAWLSAIGLLVCCHAMAAEPVSPAASNPPQAVTQVAPETPETHAEFAEAYKRYQQLIADGKREEALPYAERAYQLGLQLFGENHKNSAALALNYGDTLEKTGHRKEAVPVLDKAIELYQKLYGTDSREMVDPLMGRGNATPTWDSKEQTKYYDRAIDIVRRTGKPDDLLLAHLNLEAGIHLLRDGNADDSKRYLEAGYEQYHKQLAANDSRVVIASFWLGKYWLAVEKPRAAEPYLTQVITATDAEKAQSNPLAQGAHALLVAAYQVLGEPAKATPHCLALGRIEPWDGKTDPTPLYKKTPDYPDQAKGRDGYALIEFTIDASGSVRDPKLLKTEGSDSFGEPALGAIAVWRYAPRFVDGKPVDTSGVRAMVEFKLTP
jgi:TonB family protein